MAKNFRVADSAQQVVGGFLLAGPFVVTEEVWVLASKMTVIHAVLAVAIVAGIGYGALYGADTDREAEVAGVPHRFLSPMAVSFGSVAILALVLTASRTFLIEGGILADPTLVAVALTTLKAVTVGGIFSVVGAATADSIC